LPKCGDKMTFFKSLRLPFHVNLEVTSVCNLQCWFCYAKHWERPKTALSTDKILKIIDKLAKAGVYSIFFTGGEPLTRRDLPKIVSHSIKSGINVTISTNGTLLTRDVVEELYSAGLDEIQISMQSPNPNRHDEIVGVPGAFDKTEKGVERAVDVGMRVIIAVVGTKSNYTDIPPLFEWALSKGAKVFRVLRLIPNSPSALKEVLGREEIDYIVSRITAMEGHKKAIIDIHVPPFYIPGQYSNTMKYPYIRYPRLYSALSSTCTAGRATMAILATGEVVPCIEFRSEEFYCGNILEKEIEEVWNHPNMLKLRNATPDKYDGIYCSKCSLKFVCYSARCIAYRFDNSITGDDITCLKIREQKLSSTRLGNTN